MTSGSPEPPAGWYDVPSGGKRFWNGREWSSDVTGAPSAQAEYAALDPYLPPPAASATPVPLFPPAPLPASQPTPHPAGWYSGPTGAMQWWDGRQWGAFAPGGTVVVRPAKEVGIAYLFLILLGGFSAHRFYLGMVGSAIAFNALWWIGWMLTPLLIGIPMVFAAGVWWFVDLFLVPSLVRGANRLRAGWS